MNAMTLKADYEAAQQSYDVMDLVAYAADPESTLERRRTSIRAANICAIAQSRDKFLGVQCTLSGNFIGLATNAKLARSSFAQPP